MVQTKSGNEGPQEWSAAWLNLGLKWHYWDSVSLPLVPKVVHWFSAGPQVFSQLPKAGTLRIKPHGQPRHTTTGQATVTGRKPLRSLSLALEQEHWGQRGSRQVPTHCGGHKPTNTSHMMVLEITPVEEGAPHRTHLLGPCLRHHNKLPKAGGLNNRHLLLTFLEAGCLSSRCLQGQVLVRIHFQVADSCLLAASLSGRERAVRLFLFL